MFCFDSPNSDASELVPSARNPISSENEISIPTAILGFGFVKRRARTRYPGSRIGSRSFELGEKSFVASPLQAQLQRC